MSVKRWIFAIVSFAAAIGVSLYIVLSSWPKQHAAVSMGVAAHGVLLCIALSELLARGAKVWLSAIAMRIPMSYRLALRASAGGDFGAAITPNKSGAEPARYLIMTEDGMKPAQILLVIYAELFLEMISLALVAFALFLIFRNAGSTLIGVVSAVGLYALFVLGTGALGWYPLGALRHDGPGAQVGAPVQAARRAMEEGAARARDAAHGDLAASGTCAWA